MNEEIVNIYKLIKCPLVEYYRILLLIIENSRYNISLIL